MSLTRKGAPFVWTDQQQTAFDALKACLLSAPILGFPTEEGRFVLDTDASLFAVGGVLNQIHNEEEVVIAYANRSLRISQCRYCTTRPEMLAAVVMCTHFRSYLRGSRFSLRTDHSSLRWLQKFKNEDGMLAAGIYCWASSQLHSNIDRGHNTQTPTECLGNVASVGDRTVWSLLLICQRPTYVETQSVLMDQPFASSEMGDSMDADLLPELSGETWVASALLEELTADLPTVGSDIDLIAASRDDITLGTVRSWLQSGSVPPWSACAGLSPELRCWRLQLGNLSVDTEGRLWRRHAPPSEASQLVVPIRERRDLIRRFHDSLFARHLGVTRTVFRLQNQVYWPGIRCDVRTYIASCTVCLARKSPCPRRAPMGHVEVGHRWDRVAMDLLDMSVTTTRGNRYVLVMVDCFSRWTEACPLPDKTAQSVADAFFNQIVCRFGMPIVIHSDQGRKFENRIMQELCILCGSHKTRTTPYHPESDGLV